ncbi:MAG TPA: SIS domain-containing protein [Candidatus Limnocylindrales bacterium]|nr:SIS domain-containing protein [Candidatus Limnocylindrales bacterium]
MTLLDTLVDEAIASELFTAPRIEADLTAFLAEQTAAIKALARRTADGEFERVYFVGGGGSLANMLSGAYAMDRWVATPSLALPSYELTWRDPAALGPRSLVFLASYSGATEDTLAAMRYANAKGATTVAIARRRPSPMADEADVMLDYDSTALYDMPLAVVLIFAAELALLTGSPRAAEAQAVLHGLAALPPVLGQVYRDAQAPALEHARRFLSATMLYCVAAGPLAGLAYKFALTVFMENIRVHGSYVESAELRHGPVEAFERQRPDMVFLKGTDESRAMTQRAVDISLAAGARALVLDAADYPAVHPLLTPFVLLIPLQWFTVYSALLRGITDLDERVFMGHRVLATGPDATWP